MGRTQHFCLLITLATFAIPSLFAGTVFNDFGPANSYNPDGGGTVEGSSSSSGSGYYASASAFTSTGNFTLSQIDVAVAYVSGSPESFTVDLDSDSGGSPGSVLASWTVSSGIPSFTTCCAVETVTPGSSVSLSAGSQYWLVVSPSDPSSSTWDAWNFNDTGVTGNMAFQQSPGGSYVTYVDTLAAFDVLGNPSSTSAVPEPASLALAAAAVTLLAAFARRRKLRA